MSPRVVQPMDSYRLAEYAKQVPCFICDGANSFDTELCRHCHAPMGLAHQAQLQKTPPQLVAVIGSAGAGKTVYLGMLADMLSRHHKEVQILARGAFSITLQQATVGALSRCEFPAKTPGEPDRWNWVHWQVNMAARRQPLELIIPDIAGEAILEEVEHPHTYPAIHSFLSKCIGAIVLVDASQIGSGNQEQDFLTMKLLSYLSEINNSKKNVWRKRPLAMVFSKADECELCFDDPAKFAKTRSPGLWELCQERFGMHQFFASGVAGSCAIRNGLDGKVRVPLRIEPRGIVEPFQWLANKIK
jgi:hypothetical protein